MFSAFSHEDIFVREMLIHRRPLWACKAAFPYMLPEYYVEAVGYMMENPEIQYRIDAGFLYMYRHVARNVDIPELKELTDKDRKGMLERVADGKHTRPQYVRTEEGLHMIMAPYTDTEIEEAKEMLELWKAQRV